MKLLFATSEAAPFIKTGGLGDVSQALPAELARRKDIEVCVILPYYKTIKNNPAFDVEFVTSFGMMLAWRNLHVGVFRAERDGVTYYFIDNEYYFLRDSAYGDYDDGERYAYFCKAVLESLAHIGFVPDVIHCNDWQTALIPLYLKAYDWYSEIKTVYTIHNIEYQGKAPNEFLSEVIGLGEDWRGVVDHDGCVNFMKCAIELADCVTTVSDAYSHEIRHAYFAHGLESVLQHNAYKLSGIVNGIDTVGFDPSSDPALEKHYSAKNTAGKRENKLALQHRLGLPDDPDVPMIAMISRLVGHKGLDLLEYVAEELSRYQIQFVVLGTGEERFERLFRDLAWHHPEKFSANIMFDGALANQIYAASDFFLMPSKSEPCGLSQMIAMRYGSIPIVRETGGLVDTVPPLNVETLEGVGFTFKAFNAHDMLDAINRALTFYYDGDKRAQTVKNIMSIDNSWKRSAEAYINLYKSVQ